MRRFYGDDLGEDIELDVDTTYILNPDVEPIETIDDGCGCEYVIGLMLNGYHCIKSPTYKAGYGLRVLSVGRSVHIIKENEAFFQSLLGD